MQPFSVSRVVFAALLLAALTARADAAGVIPVDPIAGLGDASENLQAAIDEASEGDILLLLPGDYAPLFQDIPILIDGKGLTLVAAEGAQPAYIALHVMNVPAGQMVVLRGIDLHTVYTGFVTNDAGALRAMNCAGTLWVEDCTFTGGNQLSGNKFAPAYTGIAGARVENCAAAHFTRCTLTGGIGAPEFKDIFGAAVSSRGGYGAGVTASSATFQQCTLTGGSGGPGQQSTAGGSPGGAGLFVETSHVLLAGSSATGGAQTIKSGAPGAGVFVKDALSAAWLRDASAAAGAGTLAAQDVDAPAGTTTVFAAPSRSLVVDSPLHEQQAGTLTVQGQPGDLVALFTSLNGGVLFVPGKQGALELGVPFVGPFLMGTVSAGGTLTIPFAAPDLFTPGQLGQTYLLQLAVKDAAGPVTFEGGSSFVLLDSTVP